MRNREGLGLDTANTSVGPVKRFEVGLFDWVDPSGAEPLAEHYKRRFELVELAEEAGFYAYQVAEHHGTPLSVAPSPSVYLAALTQRTSTIRLCPLVYLLPMHDPLRLVEEICMLDHLSGGRLEVGVGRGASPYELGVFGISVEDSRAVFEEALDVIVQGLRDGRVDFHGKFHTYDDVLVPIRPYQDPYPPLWYPTISAGSVPWIAEHGLNTIYGFGFLSPTTEDTAAQRVRFDAVRSEHPDGPDRINGHVAAPRFGLMRQIYVADSDETAMDEARQAFGHFYKSFDYLWALHKNDRFPRNPDFDGYVAKGLVLCGNPDTVRRVLVDEVQATGADYFAGAFAFGDMDLEQARRSMRLFDSEIRPALDELAATREAGAGERA
jgi:alkanesulfonate monooxygenase SsuD/methylene tetrahydromethanopterin reductase-like flavin-dependent oxidoreductase (luciferase family)